MDTPHGTRLAFPHEKEENVPNKTIKKRQPKILNIGAVRDGDEKKQTKLCCALKFSPHTARAYTTYQRDYFRFIKRNNLTHSNDSKNIYVENKIKDGCRPSTISTICTVMSYYTDTEDGSKFQLSRENYTHRITPRPPMVRRCPSEAVLATLNLSVVPPEVGTMKKMQCNTLLKFILYTGLRASEAITTPAQGYRWAYGDILSGTFLEIASLMKATPSSTLLDVIAGGLPFPHAQQFYSTAEECPKIASVLVMNAKGVVNRRRLRYNDRVSRAECIMMNMDAQFRHAVFMLSCFRAWECIRARTHKVVFEEGVPVLRHVPQPGDAMKPLPKTVPDLIAEEVHLALEEAARRGPQAAADIGRALSSGLPPAGNVAERANYAGRLNQDLVPIWRISYFAVYHYYKHINKMAPGGAHQLRHGGLALFGNVLGAYSTSVPDTMRFTRHVDERSLEPYVTCIYETRRALRIWLAKNLQKALSGPAAPFWKAYLIRELQDPASKIYEKIDKRMLAEVQYDFNFHNLNNLDPHC